MMNEDVVRTFYLITGMYEQYLILSNHFFLDLHSKETVDTPLMVESWTVIANEVRGYWHTYKRKSS